MLLVLVGGCSASLLKHIPMEGHGWVFPSSSAVSVAGAHSAAQLFLKERSPWGKENSLELFRLEKTFQIPQPNH